jgi:G3E family GTPase
VSPKLILVGGFLGSGKTTLLKEAARRLSARGQVVGLVTNDQAPDLVDTAILTGSGTDVEEVSGSCFCCNFAGFEQAVQSLIHRGASVIVAEPVGSCTDLAATVVAPLKDRRPDIDLAPLTVLVSPQQVRVALKKTASALHDNAVYILGLQMAEADHLLLNKTDLLASAERAELTALLRAAYPDTPVAEMSARTGEGVDEWLDCALVGGRAGAHIQEVDYDRYAEGEAVLGWLNAGIRLQSASGDVDFLDAMLRLLDTLHAEFRASRSEIGHLKATVESEGDRRTANLTRLDEQVMALDRTPLSGKSAQLILNVRVQMPASDLERIARRAIAGLSGPGVAITTTASSCLTPGRPQPTYRCRTSGTPTVTADHSRWSVR